MKAKILVVDDSATLCQLLSELLEEAGYDVQTAADGKQALELLESGKAKPDLLVLDVIMPEMDGYTLLRHLRAQPETRQLPVLMLSAKEEANMLDLLSLERISGYLEKPCSPSAIVESVTEIIRETKPV